MSVRSQKNRQRRCRPGRERAWIALAVAILVAATNVPTRNMVHALAIPQLRSRSLNTMTALRSSTEEDKKRASPDFEQRKNGKEDISKVNGKQQEVRNGTGAPPGSPLSMICEEAEQEDSFEIHVGRALDTLRKDYPHMLTDQPDFAIFDKAIEVIDPTGVKLHGLKNYKNAFRLVHAIVQVFYCRERSGLTFRLCYDTARQNIRVSWNAEVVPKAIFGGIRQTLHVDGISVYEISRKTGMITQHRIERLVMNDTPVRPQQGIFAMLRSEHDESIPVFNSMNDAELAPQTPGGGGAANMGNALLEFKQSQQPQSVLFADSSSSTTGESSDSALSAVSERGGDANDGEEVSSSNYPGMDWEAYERKNASRKKFGLDPLTPEEFQENEAIVRQMDSQQRQRAASAGAAEMTEHNKSRRQGFLERLFGDVLPEACESNFDCERPEICCDFGFKKICCASGTFVGNQQQYEPGFVPVPADIYPPGEEPRNYY